MILLAIERRSDRRRAEKDSERGEKAQNKKPPAESPAAFRRKVE
jgi:hypothetical protein